jgi:hypothetical protein
MHPGIAVLATAVHFAVPGTWLNGGYTELVEWGLVTNVAGGSLSLLASAALSRFVLNREHGMGVLAVLAAAAGACTNPRSLFAVVIASMAILVAAGVAREPQELRKRLSGAVIRIGIVGGLAALLAAPVVLSLFRYNAEYFFLHYQFYDPLSMYWDASVAAVTLPVVILAAVGIVVPVVLRTRSVSLAMAITLGLYVLFTIWVATSSWVPPLVEQLEAPRLMPFQRQLMIWFGAVAVGFAVKRIGAWRPASRRWYVGPAILGSIAIAVLFIMVRPMNFVPQSYQGLRDVGTTGDADFATFQQVITSADALQDEGTSIFVIGNRADWWHQQLWGPTRSDAPFYYDDWMWYWTRTHQGPYDYRNGHYFPNPAESLNSEYLHNNGISVVVVTEMPEAPRSPREAARSSPLLAFVETIGVWDIYEVKQATALVTNGDTLPKQIEVNNERIAARFDKGDGTVVIRRNWFPRWEVYASGEAVPVTHRDDGYMEVSVPPGPVTIEIRYGVTAADWAGRLAAAGGVVGTGIFAVTGRRYMDRLPGHRERTG